MMKHFKSKRYWILMPPFFITFVLLYIFLPYPYKLYSPGVILVFWIVYYLWIDFVVKKHRRERRQSLDQE
ncbi:hypothetical protein HM131_02090 [Halobacillus mangrovi]|uniref:Uncharacterized protein n=1 Tax=Halobacillus mangrovi TaxID=402384 RepID=A0A1W5ZQX4_9BACI|nr:hypothetical protein HM131_02090 [Halobacillus mangrovi]